MGESNTTETINRSKDDNDNDKLENNHINDTNSIHEKALSQSIDAEENLRGNEAVDGKFYESNAGDGTNREDHYLHGYQLFVTYISIALVFLVVSIDQTIAMSILDTLSSRFNEPDKVTWIMGAFTLGNGVFVQTWGKLGIIFGRKWTILVAVVVFEVGSLICALSQSMNMLIGGRTIQGIGAGGLQGLVSMVIAEMFPIHRRSIAIAGYSVVLGTSAVLGPFIGGALAKISWRWCFFINLPVAGVSASIFFIFYNPPTPKGPKLRKLKTIDITGTFLFAGGIAILLVGLTIAGGQYPWKSAAVISCIVIGPIVFAVFVYWNFYVSKYPLFPKDTLKTFQVQISFLGTFFGASAILVTIQFLSLYYEIIRDKSPFDTGVQLLPILVPMILANILTGVAIGKTRFLKPITLLSGMISVVASGLLVLIDKDTVAANRIGFCILVGLGGGMVAPPLLINAQLNAPKTDGSTILVASYLVVGRNIGVSFFSALSEIVYISTIKNSLNSNQVFLSSGFTALDVLNDDTIVETKLNAAQRDAIANAYMKGIHGTFYFTIGIAGIFLVIVLFMSNKRVPKRKDVSQNKHSG